MKKFFYFLFTLGLFACNHKKGSPFTVEGTVKNSNGRKVFLEESAADGSRPIVIDSSVIEKDGSFKLTTLTQEENIYSLRSDETKFPFALLVNDSRKVTVHADPANQLNPYTVKGSKASEGIIDFDKNLNQQTAIIYQAGKNFDSLNKLHTNNSVFQKAID